MAGRAGRRGIDAEGTCVIALDARDGLDDVLRVVDGSPEPIESQFKLGYGSVALLAGDGRRAGRCCAGGSRRRSASTRTSSASASVEARRRARSRRSLEARAAIAAPCGEFERIGRYRRARQEVEARRRQARGRRRRGERGSARVIEAEPGRLALVRRSGAPTLAVILGIHAIRGHRVLVDALLPHGAVVRVKAGVIKRIFWATPPLHVPRDRGREDRDRGATIAGCGISPSAAELERSRSPS